MNPLFVSRASQQITLEELPEGVREEFLWRQKFTVYRLPDWVRANRLSPQLHRAVPPSTDVEAQNLRPQGCEEDFK